MGRNAGNGTSNITKIGFMMLVQRGGHTNDDNIHSGNLAVICGRSEAILLR